MPSVRPRGPRSRGPRPNADAYDGDPASPATAEAGIAVFRVAFERWINEARQRDLPRLIRESLDELKALTASD